MKISIITACYNSSLTILDAIESVNMQSYTDIEHIFIDGASNDNTTEIIRLNSKRNHVLISEEDNGLYDALNKGIYKASGDIIGFLHSDDLFSSSEIIEEIVTKIKIDNLDGIYGDLQYVNKFNINKIIRLWESCEFKSSLLSNGWMPAHPTLFLNKKVYDNYGVFNTKFKISADYDFILRIFKDNRLRFGYFSTIITKMRVGGASNRSIKNIIKKTKEDYRAVRLNNIGGWFTVLLKNTNKIKQFVIK